MIIVSAPGKCIIIGEHSVVYNEPAIIAAIGMRTYVKIKPAEDVTYMDVAWPDISHTWKIDEVFELAQKTLDLWAMCNEKKDFSELFDFVKKNKYEAYRASVLGIAMKMLGINKGFSIEIGSNVPIGSGLGSSSSRAVAIAKALSLQFNKKSSMGRLNDIAYELEKIIHGTPGGGDNAASCYGGLIWFQRSAQKNTIIPLRKEIPYKLENFVLVNVGTPEKRTGELVQAIRDLPEDYRNPRIKSIGKMAYEMRDALAKKDFGKMKQIINKTQKALAELGVSRKDIDELASAVREIDGAAKLCGGGGGGVVLCWHEDKEKLTSIIKDLGYEPWETELAVDGVRFES